MPTPRRSPNGGYIGTKSKKSGLNADGSIVQRCRESYGIILLSYDKRGEPHVILVERRCTYAFCTLVNGHYTERDVNNPTFLRNMFNSMTHQERLVVNTLEFDRMWFHLWYNEKRKTTRYYAAKHKFEANFLKNEDTIYELQMYLCDTKGHSPQNLWEIPKGRKDSPDEHEITCAMREFREETKIKYTQYRLNTSFKYVNTYIDNGTKYVITYYIAYADEMIKVAPDVNHGPHKTEIMNTKWVPLSKMDSDDPMYHICKKAAEYLKKFVNVKSIRS